MRALLVPLKALFMAACAVTIFGPVTAQLRKLDRFIPVNLPPWMAVAGLALMVAGALLAFLCFSLFAKGGALTPGACFPDPEVFISGGPYKYVRNPMSEGALTVLAGWGLVQRSPSILLFAITMAGLMHLLVSNVEEPKLERRFGDSYRNYMSRVNRWLPRKIAAREPGV